MSLQQLLIDIYFYGNNKMYKNNKKLSRHAEIDLLCKIKKYHFRKQIDILVVRITKNNILGESKPCYYCYQSLKKSKIPIRYIYFSTKEGNIDRIKLKDFQTEHVSEGFCFRCSK